MTGWECFAVACRTRIPSHELFCGRHDCLIESDTRRVLLSLHRRGENKSKLFLEILGRAQSEILEKTIPPQTRAFEWDTPALVLALAIVSSTLLACSPIAPSPAPAPPSSGAVLAESPRPELPPGPEPEYFAALSIASTVVCHPAYPSPALDLAAPIETYVHADPPAVRYEWDFGAGDAGRFVSSAGVVRYQYRSEGWKTINVTIEDARGRRAHNAVQILVLAFPAAAQCH